MKCKNTVADLWVKQIVLELKSEYRELIYPISMLQFEEYKADTLQDGFATDGITVYYHPEYIYEYRKDNLKLQLLHIILHGLLGHFELKDEYRNREFRDFMMDMQVEYVLMKMKYGHFHNQKELWNKLDKYVHGDYSISIYRRLCEEKIQTEMLDYYSNILRVDNHEIWDKGKEENRKKCIKLWSGIRKEVLNEKEENNLTQDAMNKFTGSMAGRGSSGKKSLYKVSVQKRVNYKELLEELICISEADKEEPDSIDYMLYQYGLELYEDIPLMEAAEEPTGKAFHMIAIAVDVSGSCVSDEQMELFWGETYECMLHLKDYCKEMDVLLLQCDDLIQWEQKMNLQDLNKIPEEVMVHGGGGTCFVPVFERLNELEQAGNKIDALLYLTDGNGEYPEEKPNYPVYFILGNEEAVYYKMPEWINVVKLE